MTPDASSDLAPAPVAAAPKTNGGARLAVVIAAIIGVSLMVGLVAYFGFGAVLASVARIGLGGFVVFCLYTLANFVVLALAWFALAPGLPLRAIPALYWGRLMREAASDVLPFSQLGGLVIGARAAATLGAPSSATHASTVVDISTELVGQLLFTFLGLGLVATGVGGSSIRHLESPPFIVGLSIIALIAVSFMLVQWKGVALLRRLSVRWAPWLTPRLDALQDGVGEVYEEPLRVLASVALHFVAWITATGGVWLALRFMHAPLSLPATIALESLIYLVRSAAFLIPGAIGVMEGGYVLLVPMFGLPPEIGLALALIKRGRDLAIGAPAVLIWQAMEGKRLLARRRATPKGAARRP
jgi:putative membrane protein